MDSELAKISFTPDNENECFTIILKTAHFQSVNRMYEVSSSKRPSRHIYASEQLVKQKNEIKEQLAIVDPVKACPWIKSNEKYYVDWTIVMNKKFWGRDLENTFKALADAVFESLGVDDSRIIEYSARKLYKKDAKVEYVIAKIGISKSEINF